jgi:hypothetical protein
MIKALIFLALSHSSILNAHIHMYKFVIGPPYQKISMSSQYRRGSFHGFKEREYKVC